MDYLEFQYYKLCFLPPINSFTPRNILSCSLALAAISAYGTSPYNALHTFPLCLLTAQTIHLSLTCIDPSIAVNNHYHVSLLGRDHGRERRQYAQRIIGPTLIAIDGIQTFMLDVWIGFHAILASGGGRDSFILLAIHPRFHLGRLTKLGIAYVSPIQELVSSSSTHA
jgi:hypothetical protein